MLLFVLLAAAGCVNDLTPDGGWSALVEDGDYLYLGNRDGHVVRVLRDSGALDMSWRFPQSDDVGEIYGTPLISDGTLFGSGYTCRGNNCDGQIFAVDVLTGNDAWATGPYKLKTKLIGRVGLGDGVLVAGTTEIDSNDSVQGFLLALDPNADAGLPLEQRVTSRELWRLPVDGPVWGGIEVAGSIAYFGTMKGTLYAVDLAASEQYGSDVSARVLWRFKVGGAVPGQPLVADGKVYVGDLGNSVHALDLESRSRDREGAALDSATEWKFDAGGWVWGQPLLHERVLYVANVQKGEVFALNAMNGSQVWQRPAVVEKEIVGGLVVVESSRGPALAVPSGEEDVHVVTLRDGQAAGRLDTDGRGVKSTPVVAGQVLFVHTDDGQLRQFQSSTLSLVNCIEPQGDGRRCG